MRLTLNNAEIQRMTTGESGPVIRELMRRAELLVQAAKRQVRVGHVAAGQGSSGVNLRDTITKRIVRNPTTGGIEIVVGSNHPIALIHHEGTRPHLIRPRPERLARNPNAMLAFPGGGGVIFAREVHHPGTHPNRYLSDNLPIITRR